MMSSVLKYFMWGYQPHFTHSARFGAERLFGTLDTALDPEVGLVGFLRESRDDRHQICIEPQDWRFQPSVFATVEDSAAERESADPDQQMLISDPHAEEQFRRRIANRAMRGAILGAIEQSGLATDRTFFCGGPTRVEGFDVFVVLGLSTPAVEVHPQLQTQTRDRMAVPTSLMQCAIDGFLADCAKDLCQPDPGRALGVGRGCDEVLRSAAANLMYAPSAATKVFEGLHGLYGACNLLSAAPYEGKAARGTIVVAPPDHPNLEVWLRFARPVGLRKTRAIRKLLCMAESDESVLLTDSHVAYGVGRIVGTYDETREDLFIVSFHDVAHWELAHASTSLMEVRFGEPGLARPRVDRPELVDRLRRIVGAVSDDDAHAIWRLVSAAEHLGHGATLVITRAAQAEAERLAAQSTPVEPLQMTPELLRLATQIDGAVLLDPTGQCFAIGVILDGPASTRGDPGRGSRFNSAVRYCDAGADPTLAVVVSDDGSIDLVPHLRPQIRRADLESAVAEVEALAAQDEVDPRDYHRTLDLLSGLRFYLSGDQCERVNKARDLLHPRVLATNRAAVVYSDFEPHDEMDDTYFCEK